MANLEGTNEQINERLGSIERRLDTGFAALDQKIGTTFNAVIISLVGNTAVIIASFIGAVIALHH